MCADGIEAVLFNRTIFGDNQVGGFTLQTLNQGAVSGRVGLGPCADLQDELRDSQMVGERSFLSSFLLH